MTERVITATLETPIEEVLREMQTHRINGTIIVDDEQHVLGVVTQGDIFRAALPTEAEVLGDETYLLSPDRLKEHIREALLQPAGTIMSRRVVSVAADSPAALAGGIMLDHRMKQLPVVDSGKLMGIIAIADITKHFL